MLYVYILYNTICIYTNRLNIALYLATFIEILLLVI